MRKRPTTIALTALLALAAGCAREVPPGRALELVRIHNDPDGVFLNEKLVFQFSEPLDETSVHAESLVLLDARGRRAEGTLEVSDRRLHFLPAPVTQPDLSDGGLRPATHYVARLLGFPSPGALRSRSGAPLSASVRFEFDTVDPSAPRTGFVFEDATPDRALPLRIVSGSPELRAGEPIVLEGGEPIDPSSVRAEDFELRRELRGLAPDQVEHLGAPVPLAVFLADNRMPDAASGEGRTLLHVLPLERLEPGAYVLRVQLYDVRDPSDPERVLRPGLGLRDFSGNPVTISGSWVTQTWPVEVVAEHQAGPLAVHREEFSDPALRTAQAVLGADGSALWSDRGLVEIRYPKAAGDGSAGAVELSGSVTATDLQASSLAVPSGAEARIDAGWSTVVLRAQGTLEVAGRLVRRFPERAGGRDVAQGGEPLVFEGGAARPLSAWLAGAAEQQRGWTVLIAGGDLVISGTLRIPGGVLLVAGGRIRSSGTIQSFPNGSDLDPYRLDALGATGPDPVFQDAAPHLFIDAPSFLELREPLTFAVLSGPVPQIGRAARWREAVSGGHAGTGAWSVRFLDADVADVQVGDPRAVVQPGQLEGVANVRMLCELSLPAAPAGGAPAPWDPPSIDFVELTYEPKAPGRQP